MPADTPTSRARFVMLGGFLGAGKTTTISKLAQAYVAAGHRVAIVTNDQANDLVDTSMLAAQGFEVGEVPGACFCCKFDELLTTMRGLSADQRPDIILAEPVGSCTDLVATVAEPIRRFYGGEFVVAPYVVLVKPEHGLRILAQQSRRGFSPQAEYIFMKQLEEAEVIVINKIDKLSESELERLVQATEQVFPGRTCLQISARQNQGIDQLVVALDAEAKTVNEFVEMDYDTYAEGEAELGWLNATYELSGNNIQLDAATWTLVDGLRAKLLAADIETAHLKVLAKSGDAISISNLVSSDSKAELSAASDATGHTIELIVNARVATSPEKLEQLVRDSMKSLCQRLGCQSRQAKLDALSPGRPEPTHVLR